MAQQTDPRILGTEPIGKLLLQYSIPAIIGMTITSLYNIIDSIFIGHGVGPMAISGLAITFPLMNLVVAFCVLISAGGATISSIRLGQKDIKGATDVLGNTLMLCLTNAVLFGGLAYLFLDPILFFFGASTGTLPYARDFYASDSLGNPHHLYHDRVEQRDACYGISEKGHVDIPGDSYCQCHHRSCLHFPFRLGDSGSCYGYSPVTVYRNDMGSKPLP